MKGKQFNGPLCLIIMDGVADNPREEGNAVVAANTPTLDSLRKSAPMTQLITWGEAVGLPEGQMGNSEVGHLNIGAGRVVKQELTIINDTVRNQEFDQIAEFKTICSGVTGNSALQLIGLVSHGGVHSSLEHLKGIVKQASELGVQNIFVHCITDGRDRPPNAAIQEVVEFDSWLKELCQTTGVDARIVSVIGRYFAMDRDTRWERTKKAYDLFVSGHGAPVANAHEALLSVEKTNSSDEFLVPFLINCPQGKREGLIQDGDSLLFFNFRADRMRQIAKAFFLPQGEFDFFERSQTPSLARISSLTEYEDDFPLEVLFRPKVIDNHFGEFIAAKGLTQLRLAETEKYPHVTYFFNAGNETPFENEERILIPSPRDVPTYDCKPEMSAAGVTSSLLEKLRSPSPPDVVIVNYANGDMVGHTGDFEATKKAVETVDEALGQILAELKKLDGVALITADHGNADQMIDYETGNPHTFHTTHPVPFFLVGNSFTNVTLRGGGALCDIAPTMCELLGLEQPAEMSGESLISPS